MLYKTDYTTLSRHGYQRNVRMQNGLQGKSYGLLDSLVVYRGGNQPRMITDMATTDYGHPAEYRDGAATWYEKNHDKNGNMTKDLNKNISSITWNSLNLPSSITFSTGHRVYYTYDAMGRKQRVIYQTMTLPAASIYVLRLSDGSSRKVIIK